MPVVVVQEAAVAGTACSVIFLSGPPGSDYKVRHWQ